MDQYNSGHTTGERIMWRIHGHFLRWTFGEEWTKLFSKNSVMQFIIYVIVKLKI